MWHFGQNINNGLNFLRDSVQSIQAVLCACVSSVMSDFCHFMDCSPVRAAGITPVHSQTDSAPCRLRLALLSQCTCSPGAWQILVSVSISLLNSMGIEIQLFKYIKSWYNDTTKQHTATGPGVYFLAITETSTIWRKWKVDRGQALSRKAPECKAVVICLILKHREHNKWNMCRRQQVDSDL